jgi:alanine racemase
MKHPSWLEIDLDRLRGNARWWQRLIRQGDTPGSAAALGAVVKADAYGLGAVAVSRALEETGVDFLIVYSLAQAQELLKAGLHSSLLVLMPVSGLGRGAALRGAMAGQRLHLSVDDGRQLRVLAKAAARLGCRLPVHLHLDTGMSRAGFLPEAFGAAVGEVRQSASLRLAGVYTHLATAPTDVGFVDEQIARLDEVVARHREQIPGDAMIHVSSTYAACRGQRYHRHLVRIGLGLYGYGPEAMEAGGRAGTQDVPQPVVRWLSRLSHVQRYSAGASVGYERTFRLTRDSVLGVIPAGYGDGYPVALSNKSSVRVLRPDGSVMGDAPQRGRVNMDQIIVDLTEMPEAKVGTTVELLSADHRSVCSAAALAKLAETNCYEILCRLSPRLPRVLVGQTAACARAGCEPTTAMGRSCT